MERPKALSEKAVRALALMKEISDDRRKKEGMNWLPSITPGTPEWSAWKAWRKEHELTTDLMERLERIGLNVAYTVPREYPPVGGTDG